MALFPTPSALLQVNVALLLLLAVNVCSAQVYISSSGLAWSGSCSGCPSSAPCQLSLASTVALSPCTLYFQGVIPMHTITASFGGNLTLTSVGSVSLGGDLLLTNPTGGIVFRDFKSSGDFGFVLTADRAYFESSSISFTDTSQITLVGSSLVTMKDTNISASNLILKCQNLVQDTWIDMSNVRLQTTVGLTETAIVPLGEPSIRIRNSQIDGLMFSTATLKNVVLENVVATISSYLFESAPSSVSISDCRLTSSTELTWRSTNSGITGALSIVRSYLKNLALVSTVSTSVNLESSTFVLDSRYAPIIDFSQGYGTKMNLTDVAIISNSATGSASVMSSFLGSTNTDLWSVSNLTYSSPSTIPRMRLSQGIYKVISPEFVVPSLQLAGSNIQFTANANSMLTFSGDITTISSSSTISFSTLPGLTLHQINVGSNVAMDINSQVSLVEYHVLNPTGKIQCATTDCISIAASVHVNVTWNSTLPLPTIGTAYTFIDGISAGPTFYTAADLEFSIVGNFVTPVASYSFVEVPCAAHCVSANSGPCVSRWRCSCKSGFQGESCECPTGGCVPTTPAASTPVTSPIANSPQAIPPVASTPLPSNSPPMASPIESPSSAPSSASNPPSVSPSSDAPYDSPIEYPVPYPAYSPQAVPSIPPSTTPPVGTPPSSPPVDTPSNPSPFYSPVEPPTESPSTPTQSSTPVSVIAPASSAHASHPMIATLVMVVLIMVGSFM